MACFNAAVAYCVANAMASALAYQWLSAGSVAASAFSPK